MQYGGKTLSKIRKGVRVWGSKSFFSKLTIRNTINNNGSWILVTKNQWPNKRSKLTANQVYCLIKKSISTHTKQFFLKTQIRWIKFNTSVLYLKIQITIQLKPLLLTLTKKLKTIKYSKKLRRTKMYKMKTRQP